MNTLGLRSLLAAVAVFFLTTHVSAQICADILAAERLEADFRDNPENAFLHAQIVLKAQDLSDYRPRDERIAQSIARYAEAVDAAEVGAGDFLPLIWQRHQTPEYRHVLRYMVSASIDPCAASAAQGTSEQSEEQESTPISQLQDRIQNSADLTVFTVTAALGTLLAFAGITLFMTVIKPLMLRQKLRRKRYLCNVEGVVNLDGRRTRITVVDISRQGAKLRLYEAVELEDTFELKFADIEVTGTRRWSNQHFVGCTFKPVLTRAQLSRTLKGDVKNLGAAGNKKAAPEGAA